MRHRKAIILILLFLTLTASTALSLRSKNASDKKINQAVHTDSEVSMNAAQKSLTAAQKEEIFKQAYTDSQVLKKSDFHGSKDDFALVELKNQNPQFYNLVELYNYNTGIREKLPINAKIISSKLDNENTMKLICTGSTITNTPNGFPYELVLNRTKEASSDDGNHFIAHTNPYYISVKEGVSVGTGPGRDILDINLTYRGIQLLFDNAMYAGAAYVPPLTVTYDENNKRVTVIAENAGISKSYSKSRNFKEVYNPYIKSVSVEEADNGYKIIIDLSKENLLYNMSTSTIQPESSNIILPYLNIEYKSQN